MNAWEAQFGYDIEKRLDNLLNACLQNKATFPDKISNESSAIKNDSPSKLANRLHCLKIKINQQLISFQPVNYRRSVPITKLKQLLLSVNNEIKG